MSFPRIAILVLSSICLSIASQAVGESDIEKYIDILDHHDPQVRMTAAQELRTHLGSETEQEIIRAINGGDLTLDQSSTLRSILYQRFVSVPRGAIGINMKLDALGIIIDYTHPGFPVHDEGLIQKGDEIIAINSVRIASSANNNDEDDEDLVQGSFRTASDQLRTIIFSYLPGDSVDLKILRKEQDERGVWRETAIVIPVTLGS
ncbi:MAG: PDZ domain-containing protein, partial [Planctomycetota bacterium]